MDKQKITPKDFFLWAGAMVALYVAVFNYIGLVWNYINYSIPDPLDYYPSDPYQSGISWQMASLIVLTPAFLLLMWFIRRDVAHDSSRREIWIRRWALFLTLFVTGVVIVGDLIYVLYAFLNGTDLTTRFLLKALIVFLVSALGFMHFLADLWNYWEKFPTRNRLVSIATILLVFATIGIGFFIVGSPQQARIYRFDDQKVSDLGNIQYQVVNYWQSKEKLPATLADLQDSISGYTVPTDPQPGSQYVYKSTGNLSFELCATFNAESQGNSSGMSREMTAPIPMGAKGPYLQNDTWQHGVGETCFKRTIDPERYPPYSKMKNL